MHGLTDGRVRQRRMPLWRRRTRFSSLDRAPPLYFSPARLARKGKSCPRGGGVSRCSSTDRILIKHNLEYEMKGNFVDLENVAPQSVSTASWRFS